MQTRLGEMLLHGGSLTEAQLEDALSAQSVYGGRLGTNLVEMGLLSEDDLARLLKEKLGVPSVERSSLEAIPPALIALVPQEMAQRFRVLPVALEGRRLTLAMVDPADFNAIDEIGFVTGLVIVPRVCSELRLAIALEHYYGIKRALRFIPVSGGVRTQVVRQTRENFGQEPVPAGGLAAVNPAPGTGGNSPVTNPNLCRHAGAGNGSAPRPETGGVDGASMASALAAGREGGKRYGMETVAKMFAAASGEAEVVTTLMSYLREEFDCAGFLRLRRGAAVGVQAVADDRAAVSAFVGCEIGLKDAPLLQHVLEQRALYLGKLPNEGGEQRLQARIGGQPGAPALLLPLVIGGVSVAFLLVEDKKGRLGSGLFDLQRVVTKAELAFEMIGIRKKIGLV